MKSLTQQLGIYLWVFYFFVSMTGVNLQSLYCYCTDEGYISLFSIEHDCEEHEVLATTHKACCKKNAKCNLTQQAASEDGDCCPPVETFLKADIDLLWVSTSLDYPTPSVPLWSPTIKVQEVFPVTLLEKSSHNYRPPPKRHGIELRHFMQSYLC